MAGKNSLLSFFINGLTLVNKTPELVVVSIAWSLTYFLNYLFPNTFLSIVISLVILILTFLQISFFLSVPFFLSKKQEDKKLGYEDMIEVTFKNTRRIILPVLLLFLLFVVLMIVVIAATVAMFRPNPESAALIFQNEPLIKKLVLIIPILTSFLVFSPVLFSVEQKSLFSSIKESIKLSFKHLRFILFVVVAGIIAYSLAFFLPNYPGWWQAVSSVFQVYINLVVVASALLYYQKYIKGKNE